MSTSQNWRSVNIDNKSALKLLVKSHFDNSGYQVEITDLSRVWGEKLSSGDIIQRALDTGSSIDPGQDDEQFKIFLGKIESALRGEDGTTLNIRSVDTDGTDILLDLSATLPKPLPPFAWTIHLKLLPAGHLKTGLMTPLLLQASNLRHQLELLVAELQDKDRVISKICDRLETSGNDLTTVFPGVSNIKTSRKKGQREQLAKHVKGLADFDENAWRTQQAGRERDGDELGVDRMNEVLSALPISSFDREYQNTSGNWWQHLEGGMQSQKNREGSAQRRSNHANRTISQKEESVQDDEFQRQSTPPHLNHERSPSEDEMAHDMPDPIAAGEKQSQVDSAMADADDSTTDEDEDDLDAAPREQPPAQTRILAPSDTTPKPMSSSPGKLGTVGGRSRQASTSPTKESMAEKKSPDPKPRSKLGTMGWKAKRSTTPSGTETGEATLSPAPKAAQMGVIGGKRSTGNKSRTATPADDIVPEPREDPCPPRSRPPVKQDTPPPRETSQERADRKRDQLKRELEQKAKAPAKKKRKF